MFLLDGGVFLGGGLFSFPLEGDELEMIILFGIGREFYTIMWGFLDLLLQQSS
jgi:hypothetical protein